MIQLIKDTLIFTFPEVHHEARLEIAFHRTLRAPESDLQYPLPAKLDKFPLRHTDDYAENISPTWIEYGGVMLPMYQSEAVCMNFRSHYIKQQSVEYPFAVKIGTGKINAISGKSWEKQLLAVPQNYVVIPYQPWLDGYHAEKGVIRQFVAAPLGKGITTEEQITGQCNYGGLQIQVYPMRRQVFDKRFPLTKLKLQKTHGKTSVDSSFTLEKPSMGVASGGKMAQNIYRDPYGLADWDITQTSRCFVHIANSEYWQQITGQFPPLKPLSAKDYKAAGLPWFEYYNDRYAEPLSGSKVLASLQSMTRFFNKKNNTQSLSSEAHTEPKIIKSRNRQVREVASE